ncbi:glutamate--tRNA ligase [Amylibacter kogurei]|uniref:Glutamate--tRNA ligase n=1 Tax=Paramylibacter kogurei TaxID=1889778 RepID=A0A2G5KAS1_9RHOB|nr:glutamate--tRNA ligase [Amylibacter kogurei]PIB25970.1 glutamate--tRNA ligase [Amylibacter kogurei]
MTTTTRFAPSPTGFIHVGNLRTALFNYMIAKQAGGKFILRLDDTDPERSKQEYADAIKQDLEWLGLHWDRVEKQSDRLDRYHAAADELRAAGRFYECFETPVELDLKRKKQLNMGKPPVYDRSALALSDVDRDELRKTRDGHWRFKLNQERINWTDGILGDLSIDAASVSDPVLIRGDGQFLYTMASVCDDIDFGITHVVRGSDHVTNTATQIQIIEALGGVVPSFAHHSLLTGPAGEALSKRLGTLSLRDLRAAGVEPMALLAHMARIGSSDPVEPMTNLDELIAGFDLSKFGSAPTKYDVADLNPLTSKTLAMMPVDAVKGDLDALGVPSADADAFWTLSRENIATRKDIAKWWDLVNNGATPLIDAEDADFIASAKDLLPPQPWDENSWKSWTTAVKDATGRKGKTLFMPLRKALTGMEHGPDMSKLMPMLKKTGL